jgi:hypothetical protein
MNLSKNLIVALLGLGCYARSNSINLANNTTILLIILALLAKQDTDNNGNVELANSRSNDCPCNANNSSYNTSARVVYTEPYPVSYTTGCYTTPRNTCHYAVPVVPYQNTVSYCTPCAPVSWNQHRCHQNYTYPCHNVLY